MRLASVDVRNVTGGSRATFPGIVELRLHTQPGPSEFVNRCRKPGMAEDVDRQQPIPQEDDDLRDPLRRDIEDQLGTRVVEQVDWFRPVMRWIERTIDGMAWRPSDGLASEVARQVIR